MKTSNYVLSRYVKGLRCFNNNWMIYHVYSGKVFVLTDALIELIEKQNIECIPSSIVHKLVEHEFLIKENTCSNLNHSLESKDVYIYCNLKESYSDDLYYSQVLDELSDVTQVKNTYFISTLSNALLDKVPLYPNVNYIFELSSENLILSQKQIEKLSNYSVGLIAKLNDTDIDVSVDSLKKIYESIPLQIEVSTRSMENFFTWKSKLESFKILIDLEIESEDQTSLIDIYDRVNESIQNTKNITMAWNLPYIRLKNENTAYKSAQSFISLKGKQSLSQILQKNDMPDLESTEKKDTSGCTQCSLVGVCGDFLSESMNQKRPDYCFLSKYAIAQNIESLVGGANI